jgi:hypothetical protein
VLLPHPKNPPFLVMPRSKKPLIPDGSRNGENVSSPVPGDSVRLSSPPRPVRRARVHRTWPERTD